jgi:hypothetical protein
VVPFLPVTPCMYRGHSDPTVAAPWRDLLRAGIELSSHYDAEGRRRLFRALQFGEDSDFGKRNDHLPIPQFLSENTSPNVSEAVEEEEHTSAPPSFKWAVQPKPTREKKKMKRGQGHTRTRTTTPPFYTDHSSGVEYFSELEVEPPMDHYAVTVVSHSNARIWTVQLGDAVIVHYETCAGRASYRCSADEKNIVLSSMHSSYYPFTVPWAVGEVVAILRRPTTKSSNQEAYTAKGDEADGLKIELRWFYRAKEISTKTMQDVSENDGDSEEIFESDHYDEIAPANLLAPVSLLGAQKPVSIGYLRHGMPVVEFHCQRFWSVHRRSLKPICGLEGRIERGRLHSKSFGKNESLKAALSASSTASVVSPPSLPSSSDIVSFREAFSNVIRTLSLSDASREAHQNALALVGREVERDKIASFLRAAILQNADAGCSGVSLFVAGPPGTGKTAVRFLLCSPASRLSY